MSKRYPRKVSFMKDFLVPFAKITPLKLTWQAGIHPPFESMYFLLFHMGDFPAIAMLGNPGSCFVVHG